MEKAKRLLARAGNSLRTKKMFWRILLLYVVTSVVLLTVFSAFLGAYLTHHATEDAVDHNREVLGRAYAAVEQVLNTTYEMYYKLYQSSEVSDLLFSESLTAEDLLSAGQLLAQVDNGRDCVASVYLINRAADRVIASDGTTAGLDTFYDGQALRLFQFYNENSNTLFLPRTTSFTDSSGTENRHYYITLIFSRRNEVSIPMGGMIVNLDETMLSDLIAGEVSDAGDLYVISENGSVLVNSDASRVNTSIYGSDLWEQLSAHSAEDDFSFHTMVDGEPCLVTGKNASRLRFCFLRITPVRTLQGSVSYIRNIVVLCTGVFLVVTLILATAGSRYVYQPMSQLISRLRTNAEPPASSPESPSPLPAMDEVAFLDQAYRSLFQKVETLSHDNDLMERARRREVLLHLLFGEFPTEEKSREAAAPLHLLPRPPYQAVAFLFDDFDALSRNTGAQDMALYRYALGNVAEELLGEHAQAYSAEVAADQVVVLLSCEPDAPAGWLPAALGQVCDAMKEHLHCTVSAGIGIPCDTLTGIVTSYNRAMTATAYRLVMGQGTVIAYEDIATRQNLTPEYPMELDAAIVQALRSRNQTKACAGLEEFFDGLAMANIDSINMATTQLTISLSRTVHSMAAGHEGTRQLPNYRVLSNQLASCDTLDQRREALQNYCIQVIQIRSSEVMNERETLIERVREFIETNHANPMLNTEDIAAFAELSPNYLRTVFKNAVGKSPTDYLTDCRIRHAQQLLADTDISTKEIATAVGYYNHRYFYSVFKAKTGRTATTYRAEQRGQLPAGTTDKKEEEVHE